MMIPYVERDAWVKNLSKCVFTMIGLINFPAVPWFQSYLFASFVGMGVLSFFYRNCLNLARLNFGKYSYVYGFETSLFLNYY